jgi:hypothetical protein
MKKIILSLLFAVTLLCAASSFAQTLITQTGTTTFPINLTATGSYKLNSNITVTSSSTDAIVIAAPGVTLDMNGYSIIGPLSCTNSGCSSYPGSGGIITNSTNSLVKNGYIRGFQTCAEVEFGIIENVNVSSCDTGIAAYYATVHQNVVSYTYYEGIFGEYSVLTDNTLYGNGSYGIAAINTTVISNTVTSTADFGLYVDNGVYSNNTLYSNGTDAYPVGNAVTTKNNACTSGAC